MKKLNLFLTVIILFLAAACGGNSASKEQQPEAEKNKTTVKPGLERGVAEKGKINWIGIDELEAKMKEKPRKVLVDLYTDWCGWCKRMDKATFQHPQIADYVNKNFYAVKFNAETKQPIKYKNKEYAYVQKSNSRRGTNMLTFELTQLKRASYPTISFLDESLETIKAFPGYRDPNKFDGLVHFINENHYKNKNLAQFTQTYKSSIPPTPKKNPRNNAIKLKPRQEFKKMEKK